MITVLFLSIAKKTIYFSMKHLQYCPRLQLVKNASSFKPHLKSLKNALWFDSDFT